MTEQEAKTILERDLICLKQNKALPDSIESMEIAINALEEVQQYRAIGTLEECREAVEKQIPKKPVEMKPTDKLLNGYFACPMCGGWVGMDEYSNEYCGCCGQKLDWSDNTEKL